MARSDLLGGGPHGEANQINDFGQVVGTAENFTPDYGRPSPQVLQFKPVVWNNGKVQKLQTAEGDLDGIASAVNRSGQIVDGSGLCSTFTVTTLLSQLDPGSEVTSRLTNTYYSLKAR